MRSKKRLGEKGSKTPVQAWLSRGGVKPRWAYGASKNGSESSQRITSIELWGVHLGKKLSISYTRLNRGPQKKKSEIHGSSGKGGSMAAHRVSRGDSTPNDLGELCWAEDG